MANDIDLGLIPAEQFLDEAKIMMEEGGFGTTDLYSTGDRVIDEFLGGGYGRKTGYEIVLIFGDTGRNKSTFATNLVVDPLKKGKTVAYLALEDDPRDVMTRLIYMGVDINKLDGKLMFFKEQDGYTLDKMASAIEEMFAIADVIVIDPLQFIFEASVAEKGEAEFNRQRLFMRRMNHIMKKTNKVLIIVSHTNKTSGNVQGMAKIIGSTALQQVSTKAIEVGIAKDGLRFIHLWKNRFAQHRYNDLSTKLENLWMKAMWDDADIIKKMREGTY